jgi:hypothetical protein
MLIDCLSSLFGFSTTAFANGDEHTLLRGFSEGAVPYLKTVYGGLGRLLLNLVLRYGQKFAHQTSVSIGYVFSPRSSDYVFVGCFKSVTLTLTCFNVLRHVCPSSLL